MRALYHKLIAVDGYKSDFILFIECRSSFDNLENLLATNFSTLRSHPKDLVLDALKLMTDVMVLVDGYDEINPKTRKLVEEAIDYCKGLGWKCIISGRKHATNDIEKILEHMGVPFDPVTIDPIVDNVHKEEFITKYAKGITKNNADKVAQIIREFNNLEDHVKDNLDSPIQLVLFCLCMIRSPELKITNVLDIYEAYQNHGRDQMEMKLQNLDIQDSENITEQILLRLSILCLMLFKHHEYVISLEQFRTLESECKALLPAGVNIAIKALLSYLIYPEHSVYSHKAHSYQFAHASIQEYFAMTEVVRRLEERVANVSSTRSLEEIPSGAAVTKEDIAEALGFTYERDEDGDLKDLER